MAAVGGGCTTWDIFYGCPAGQAGQTGTPGVGSVNGGGGVAITFYTDDNNNNAPVGICFPTGTSPNAGDVITTTNPSGHPGDGSVSGTVVAGDEPGTFKVKLCPPQKADV